MNNIIRSQVFIMKQKIVSLTVILIGAVVTIAAGPLLVPNPAETFSQHGFAAMFLTLLMPGMLITYCYTKRIQMYEIMAGFRPHQIILGKTIVILPPVLAFLAAASVVSLITDSSPQMVERLLLYSILCVRAVLCIVFLSPLLKYCSIFPVMSVTLMSLPEAGDENLDPIVSYIAFGQCMMLGGEITEGFVIKVIVSAVVSCVIYYLIGYLTLKKKIALELHQLT